MPLVVDVDYRVETIGNESRIRPVDGWPSVISSIDNAITLTYTAGLAATETNIPDWVKSAIVLAVRGSYDGCDVSMAYGLAVDTRKLFFDYSKNDRSGIL